MEIRGTHWTIAGATAVAMHAAVAVWVFRVPPPPAASFGGGGVQVALAPAAGPSAAEAPVGPRQDAAEVTPTPAATPSPRTAEPVQTPTPEATEAPRPQEIPPEPPAETAEPVEPETAEPVEPETVAKPVPEQTPTAAPAIQIAEAREEQPPPRPKPRPQAPKRATAPAPRKVDRPEPVQTAAAPPPSGAPSATAETQGRASDQAVGGQPTPAASPGAAAPAPAPGGAADYLTQLRAWLEQHKEYPNRARRRRIEGTAMLVFVMDRDGRVLSHRLEQSAGDPSLDNAVEEMIERAQPLPRIPESFDQAQLEIRVPVQFLLR